ncbi:hypothetical protein CKO51_24875 [Rhodopirellula sp. SM50]|nr:WD40 repeat domain-containing serine/threonine protein kinase [Rhodopirellula sp. SM50]PAY16778.1 hypothetical protein CKO51_24875 [Rhodopirellula sp. SM50]
MRECELFVQACELEDRAARKEFLDRACCGDLELRHRVIRLIESRDRLGDFMEPTHAFDAPVKSSDRSGEKIDSYVLRELIGEGGFGVVYVAEQLHPICRRVAIKLIKPGMDSRQIIARFEAERQALAMMDHPNIARVLDAGSTAVGHPYFVMELVNGMPITEYCRKQKLLLNARLQLMRSVCDAVEHAHKKGIIHRDLKPSNVMVTMHNGSPVVKVIDFGVAKAMHQRLTESTVYTAMGQLLGTPMYMSPEQAEMTSLDVDTRSDVYSLGVLLYELVTGMPPFDRKAFHMAGFEAKLQMIRETEPPRPSLRVSTAAKDQRVIEDPRVVDSGRLSASLRGDLDWIVMKALEKQRERRYQSARELASDLDNHLSDRPVVASPPSKLYRARKYLRRNAAITTIVSSFAFLLVIGAILLAIFAVNQHRLASERAAFLEDKEQQRLEAERIAQEQSLARAEADRRLAVALLEQARSERMGRKLGYRSRTNNLLREAQQLGVDEKQLRMEVLAGIGDPFGMPVKEIDCDVSQPALLPSHFASVVYPESTNQRILPPQACLSANRELLAIRTESRLEIAVHQIDKPPQVIDSHCGPVLGLSLSHSQDKLIAAGEEGFAIWQLPDLTVLHKVSTNTLVDVAAHPTMPLAAFLDNQQKLLLWSLDENRIVAKSDRMTCRRIEFTSDGEYLLLLNRRAARQGKVKAIRVCTTTEGSRRWVHNGGVTGVAVDHTTNWLATCGKDESIHIWEFPTLRQKRSLIGHFENVEEIAFSKNGKWLASADWDGNICFWDYRNGRELARTKVDGIEIYGLGISANSRFVAVGGYKGIAVFEVCTDTEHFGVRKVANHRADALMATSLVFHPTNNAVIFNSHSTFLQLDLTTGEVSRLCETLCPFSFARSDLRFLSNGKWLTGVSQNRAPIVFNWKTDEIVAESLNGKGTDAFNAHWTPDGAVAVSKPDVNTLVVHDMKRQQVLYRLPSDKFDLWASTISACGRWIISGNSKGELIVWDRIAIEKTLASFGLPAAARTSFSVTSLGATEEIK